MTARAPAPTRSTSSTTLRVGPLSIPIQIYSGTENTATRFVERHEYTADGRPVGRASVVRGTDPPEIVDRDDVISCVEYGDHLVPLSDEEVTEAIFGEAEPETTATVISFVPLHLMGAGKFLPEGLYQVRPKKGRKRGTFDPAAANAFLAVMKAMREEQVFALIELVQRSRPSFCALLPTGKMYRLLFDDEIREDLPMPSLPIEEDDVELVKGTFVIDREPDLANVFRGRIDSFIERKVKQGETLGADTPRKETETVEDLLAQLRGGSG